MVIMNNTQVNRRPLILFPQSNIGKVIFYVIFSAQVLMYVFRAFTNTDKVLIPDPPMLAFVGMLIDIVSGVFGKLIVFWFVRWILVRVNILKPKEGQKTQFSKFFITLLGIVIVGCIVLPIYVSGGFPLKKSSSNFSDMVNLSSSEKVRVREILTAVIQSDEALTPENHTEFWIYLKKMSVTEKNVDQVRDMMTGIIVKYQKYTWEAAAQALKTGQLYKSTELENYEKQLKSSGVLSDTRLNENNKFIENVAQKKPILVQGQEIIVDEERIQNVLNSLVEVAERVDKLFTPPL